MQRTFISYSRKDRTFVEQLHGAISQQGSEVWVDWKDIPLTAEFLTEILRGIEASENFLFIISTDSVGSRICQIELDHAGKLGKRLYPIIRRDVDAAVVPEQLAGVNWIFMRDGDDFPIAVASLIVALATDLEWVPFHTLVTTRASEWQRANHERSRLLSGRSLREAKRQTARWAQTPPAISDLQSNFLRASLRASGRRRWIAAATALMLVLSAVLGISLFRHQRAESRSRQAAVTAGIESQRDPEIGLLIAIEAMRLAQIDEAEASLRESMREHHEIQRIALEELGLEALVLSSDGRWLAGGGEGRIYLWDAATLVPVRPPIVARSPRMHFDWCAFSMDRHTLAARGEDGAVFWWKTADWTVQRVPQAADQTSRRRSSARMVAGWPRGPRPAFATLGDGAGPG